MPSLSREKQRSDSFPERTNSGKRKKRGRKDGVNSSVNRYSPRIQTYGIEQRTVHNYALADFYEGAAREGAREC